MLSTVSMQLASRPLVKGRSGKFVTDVTSIGSTKIGQSVNHITAVVIQQTRDERHWILNGARLLTCAAAAPWALDWPKLRQISLVALQALVNVSAPGHLIPYVVAIAAGIRSSATRSWAMYSSWSP